MRAMVLEAPRTALRAMEVPDPRPGPDDVLLRVDACAVCRTDLHIIDGELTRPSLPLILGHEIVGTVVECGGNVDRWTIGDRVGVPWLGGADGTCAFCRRGQENLCARARFTGYQVNGGFAEMTVADARFCFAIDASYDADHAAPLMCAGLIGYRAWRMAGELRRLGIYGFGAAAHLIVQVARHAGQRVFAFTRPGDDDGQRFARELGAEWSGGSDMSPPETLDGALIFAPVGALVPAALAAVERGGSVICAGIHMSDIPAFPYRLLWEERVLRSVANLTRRDGEEFLALAPRIPVRTEVQRYALGEANAAIDDLRHGRVRGAAVLIPER